MTACARWSLYFSGSRFYCFLSPLSVMFTFGFGVGIGLVLSGAHSMEDSGITYREIGIDRLGAFLIFSFTFSS